MTVPAGDAGRPPRRLVLGMAAAGMSLVACEHAGPASTSSPSAGADRSASSASGRVTGPGSTAGRSPSVPSSREQPPRRTAGPDITHGPRTRHQVALTFHGDGPTSIVRDMLTVLRHADAKVTVLAIGRWLAADPRLAAMVRDDGHELGNHTWSHRTMPRLTPAQVRTEVERAAQEIHRLTGGPGRWFRPSGTPHSTPVIRAAAAAAGYGACLGYDVDPLDYTDPGPAAIVRSLARSVRPGSIVSLHLGHPGTLAALPGILAHLRTAGLAPVTASALLTP